MPILRSAYLATIGFGMLLTGECFIHAQQLAGDWKVVPAPPVGSEELYATNIPVWKLRNDGTYITPSHWTRRDGEKQAITSLPEHLTRDSLMHGAPSSLHLDSGGWLVGFNGGEFGGGLWSTSDDGSQTKLLVSQADVHGLIRTPDGIIVLIGLAHMALNQGNASFVPNSSWDRAEAHTIADLSASPEAWLQESPSTVLVATDKAILRVHTSGTVDTLVNMPYGPMIARSIVIAADHTIYVGIRGYILKLIPQLNGYALQWLIPVEHTNG
jgi:hypothetical protein